MANPLSVRGAAGFLGCGLIAAVIGLPLLAVMFLILGAQAVFHDQDETEQFDAASTHCNPERDETSEQAPEAETPSEYEDYVNAAASEAGVPPSVLAAQIHYESGWQENAESNMGARGLAQFTEQAWATYGDGPFSNATDPESAIAAQGRYMDALRDEFEDYADDDDHLLEMMLFGYNAGQAPVHSFDGDLQAIFAASDPGTPHSYAAETQPYIENIVSASAGMSGAFCADGGETTEVAIEMAWGEETRRGSSYGAGDVKDAFAEAHSDLYSGGEGPAQWYIDCGVFVSTVVRTAGIDPDFPAAHTATIEDYVHGSDRWETMQPASMGEVEPGDVFIVTYNTRPGGHAYIYTGPRGEADDGVDHALGAALGIQQIPSAHYDSLSSAVDGTTYTVARPTGETAADESEA